VSEPSASPLAQFAGPLEWLATAVDALSIAILTLGALRFVLRFVSAEVSRDGETRRRRIDAARLELGRYILAGLELLIVSDVIQTALSFAIEDILFLGGLVLVRSVISFFLEREIKGLEQERAGDARSGA
jgi:uncharacterized membrane protein